MTIHDHLGESNREPATLDPSTTATSAPGGQQRADAYDPDRDQQAVSHASPVAADPVAEAGAADHLEDNSGIATETSTETSLFDGAELEELRREWDNVQVGFVDDPKRCVEQADGLVSNVVQQLSSGFAEARSRLEQQWSRGEKASTEDLRVALKRYREFFDRLLAV